MVGDNPESDIRGANEFVSPQGVDWASVLVGTGVWNGKEGGALGPKYVPRKEVDDVFGAVRWALREEGWGLVE